jgi:hypothetical protein
MGNVFQNKDEENKYIQEEEEEIQKRRGRR